MRLWSLHPSLLDAQGLVALWREALLVQKVLAGETRGYRHHPQLERFRECRSPMKAIGAYLWEIAKEAQRRGYSFDQSKIRQRSRTRLPVTRGQVSFESEHLRLKLKARSPALAALPRPTQVHPIFRVIPGEVESWERPKRT